MALPDLGSVFDDVWTFLEGHPAAPAAPAPVGHVTVNVALPPAPGPVVGSHPASGPIPVPKPKPDPAPIQPAPTGGVWTLDAMLVELLRNEGGFVDNHNDSGGVTNYGISLNFAVDHPDTFDLNGDGKVDRADIVAMTPAAAKAGYLKFFYYPAHLDAALNVSNLRMQLFDMAANMGVRYRDGQTQAVRCLQHAVGAPVTGVLDQKTVTTLAASVAAKGAVQVNNDLVQARIRFYTQVVAVHPKDAEFLNGWTRRANKYLARV